MQSYGPFTDALTARSYMRTATLPFWVSVSLISLNGGGYSKQIETEEQRKKEIDDCLKYKNDICLINIHEQQSIKVRNKDMILELSPDGSSLKIYKNEYYEAACKAC